MGGCMRLQSTLCHADDMLITPGVGLGFIVVASDLLTMPATPGRHISMVLLNNHPLLLGCSLGKARPRAW